ncbi:hypothetical protein [Dyadobacter fermentans]|uniref:hypothetical protein n=1 Tax=Dyadobacter fermentans TaxID=94254 RepID=UPI00031C663C|nr:hypothetical protein [Dyadobacter fermentans]
MILDLNEINIGIHAKTMPGYGAKYNGLGGIKQRFLGLSAGAGSEKDGSYSPIHQQN